MNCIAGGGAGGSFGSVGGGSSIAYGLEALSPGGGGTGDFVTRNYPVSGGGSGFGGANDAFGTGGGFSADGTPQPGRDGAVRITF